MPDMYKPEQLKEDAVLKKTIIDTAIDVQSTLQLLIAKDIITKEELDEMRSKVRTLPKYKASLDYIDNINKAADMYENDPQAYLQELLKAKMDGKIR
jgi:hypothetical protein